MTSTVAIGHSNGGFNVYKGNAILRHHSNGISHKNNSLPADTNYFNGVSLPTRSASDVCTFIKRNGKLKANGVRKDGNANLTTDDMAPLSKIIVNGAGGNNNPPKIKPQLHPNIATSNGECKAIAIKKHEETNSNEEPKSQLTKLPVFVKQKVTRNSALTHHQQSPDLKLFMENNPSETIKDKPQFQRTISEQQTPTYSPSLSDTSSPKSTGVRFSEHQPSPEIRHLQEEFFAPGVKLYFQRKTQLPLLTKTDTCILSRKPSIADASEQINKISGRNVRYRRQRELGYCGDDQFNRYTARSELKKDDLRGGIDINLIKACWNIVLSFMGDEVASEKHHTQGIFNTILSSRKKHTSSRNSNEEFTYSTPKFNKSSKSTRPKSMFLSSHDSSQASPVPSSSSGSGSTNSPVFREFKTPSSSRSSTEGQINYSASHMTVLQKVNLLCKVGLNLPFMRDEIYCMVVKQIISNPSLQSTARGWILLSLLAGTFLPSLQIFNDIKIFVNNQKHEWSSYCAGNIKRNLVNGLRSNPPCSLEIQGAKTRQPMKIPIICADKSVKTVPVDSASTAKELLKSVAEKLQIQEEFGHRFILVVENKVTSVGSDTFHIMDAISQTETYCQGRGIRSNWRLYHRRDIFSPRDSFLSLKEYVPVWLAYSQITGGIHSGEYVCKKASDLALLVAHKHCLTHGISEIDTKKVQTICEKTIPPQAYKEDKKNWVLMVVKTLQALSKKPNFRVETNEIMSQIVRFGIKAFRSGFTRTYQINTFAETGNSCTYTSDLTLHINHAEVIVKQGEVTTVSELTSGTYVERTYPTVLMTLSVKELRKVQLETKSMAFGNTLTISASSGKSYSLTSVHGKEVYEILFRFIRDVSGGVLNESDA